MADNEGSMTTVAPQGMPGLTYSREQVELIKRTVAKGATDDELALFLYTAKRLRADPLAHQIHFVKRGGKEGPVAAFQTSIDWYRLTADRTGKYSGNDDPVYDDESSPKKATVTVYKNVDGVRCPFTATARWDQYYPGEKGGFMWNKMPHLMLGKCAEALALRKAFPAELSEVYIAEELEQGEAPPSAPTPQAPKEKPAPVKADMTFLTDTVTKVGKRGPIKGSKGDFYVYSIHTGSGKTIESNEGDAEKANSIAGTTSRAQFGYIEDPKWGAKLRTLALLPAESEG